MCSFYCFSENEQMTNWTKGQGTQVCYTSTINMHINGNLNNLNMSGYHSTLRLLSSALKTRKEKMWPLSLLTDKVIFLAVLGSYKGKTEWMPDGKSSRPFWHFQPKPLSAFRRNVRNQICFPRAEIPSEIANLLFPATLIFFSDRKFLFSNHCQVVRKKLCTFSWTTFQCKNKF